jgi:hypothetical protein
MAKVAKNGRKVLALFRVKKVNNQFDPMAKNG